MEQMTIMEYLLQQTKQPLKIDKPIRLIELFAGIGSQAKALSRLGANFEHYRVCEFDKYAIKSYNAIHGTNFATSDITKITADDLGIVDTDKYCYIMTYSFPCQDLSLAGKQKGMAKGNNTRSGLLWEVERLLNECDELPQILLMENVTQVHGSKNKEHFNEWIRFLESKGYSNYWKDLNAKNFGVPQNRNRTFMVSVLGNYRYEFPKAFPLEIRLKDVLEDSVDEKFYLSDKMINYLTHITEKNKMRGNNNVYSPSDIEGTSKCITTKEGSRVKDNFIEEQPAVIGGIGEKKSNGGTQWYQQDRVYDNSIAISVTTAFNPYYKVDEPSIYEDFYKNRNARFYEGVAPTLRSERSGLKVVEPRINVCGNYSPSGHDASRIVDADGLAPTVKENHGTVTAVIQPQWISEKGVKYICDAKRGMATDVNADVSQPLTAKGQANWTGSFVSPDIESLEKSSTIGSKEPTRIKLKSGETITSEDNLSHLRIRKLTPLECWRLMGFDDVDYYKAASNSNTQLYKQAGNSIVVDVLVYIFKQML